MQFTELQIFEPTEKYIQENEDKFLEQVKAFYNGDLIHFAVSINIAKDENAKNEVLNEFALWRNDYDVVMFTSELMAAFGHLSFKDKCDYFREMFSIFEEKASENGPLEKIKVITKQEIINHLNAIYEVVNELNEKNLEATKKVLGKTLEQRIKRVQDSTIAENEDDYDQV